MKYLRTFVAAAAMMFLMGTTAAAAPPPVSDNACTQCHAGAGDAWCAGLIIYTVGNCCGSMNQTAWAWCVNSQWGFYVNCQTNQSFECQCNQWGSGCQRLGGDNPKEKEY
jgi:hypothetical protein